MNIIKNLNELTDDLTIVDFLQHGVDHVEC